MSRLRRPLHPFYPVLALTVALSLANVAAVHLGAAAALDVSGWQVFVVSAAELTGVCALFQRCMRGRA